MPEVKAKDMEPKSVRHDPQPMDITPDPPAPPVEPASPPSDPLSIPPARKTTRSWFGTSTAVSVSPPERRARAPPHPLSQTPSIPSSIDEDVPRLSSAPPSPAQAASPPEVHRAEPAAPPAQLAALNPATSRFTLSIPLLGRAKVPLEKAVAAAQMEDVRNVGKKTPVEEAVAVAQVEDLREADAPAPPQIVVEPPHSEGACTSDAHVWIRLTMV